MVQSKVNVMGRKKQKTWNTHLIKGRARKEKKREREGERERVGGIYRKREA